MPTSQKAVLYSTALDAARRANLFHLSNPVDRHAKHISSTSSAHDGLSWSELVRKFTKHTGRHVTAQAALADLFLHTHLRSPTPTTLSALHASIQSLSTALTQYASATAPEDINSARIVWAHGLLVEGETEKALDMAKGLDRGLPSAEGAWEGYGLVLRVLGYIIEARAQEKLTSSEAATGVFRRAATAYDDVVDILSRRKGNERDIVLHTLGEEAAYKTCLASSASGDLQQAAAAHRLYFKHSPSFSSLRPTNTAHLLATHNSFRAVLHALHSSSSGAEWHAEVCENNARQERVVRATTSLPRAGEVNAVYLKFLDDVAEGWRIGGAGREGASEVVEIMYNALTHTFQSQRLLRHLVRVLTAKGAHAEAAKALRLYVELFDKARETDAAQIARDVRRFRSRAAANGEKEKVVEKEKEGEEDDVQVDIDSDREFIRTLTFGTRVFCKYLDAPEEGYKLAKRAKEIFDETKDGSLAEDKVVESRVERALGVALGALTAKEADVDTREERHAAALAHLEHAVDLDPSSWETLYHLSYQLAELRQIPLALERCKQAAALNSASRDCWHLLGLLVAAQKDFGAALQVLETALDEEETPATDEVQSTLGEDVPPRTNGATPSTTNGNGSAALLRPPFQTNGHTVDADRLDTALAHLSAPDHIEFPRDETEALVAEVQIRMTKNTIVEAMEGPEAALLDQQSLFAFFRTTFSDVKEETEAQPTSRTPVLNSTSPPVTTVRRAASLLSRKKSVRATQEAPPEAISVPTLSVPPAAPNHTPLSNTPNGSFSNLSLYEPSAGFALESNPRATKLLTDIWLLAAASYRRAGKLEDARGAIQEAELLNADDPDVWVQFALYNLALSGTDLARTCLMKALALSPTHVPALIHLARLYLTISQPSLAEGLLQVTKREAWDVPEAWFELSRCYKATRRTAQERECLIWALQLQDTRSIRSWSCLPRLL